MRTYFNINRQNQKSFYALEKPKKASTQKEEMVNEAGEGHRAVKRQIMDNPNYDPLWGAHVDRLYAYISHGIANREDYTISQYIDPLMGEISSMIPRLVVDFPYMKVKDASELKFDHDYLLETFYRKVVDEREKQEEHLIKQERSAANLKVKQALVNLKVKQAF